MGEKLGSAAADRKRARLLLLAGRAHAENGGAPVEHGAAVPVIGALGAVSR
jgi:hypothetical protein